MPAPYPHGAAGGRNNSCVQDCMNQIPRRRWAADADRSSFTQMEGRGRRRQRSREPGRVRAAAGSVVDARRKEAPLKHLHGHRPHDPDPPCQGWRGRGLAAAGGPRSPMAWPRRRRRRTARWLDEDENAVSDDLFLRLYSTHRLPDPLSTLIIRTPYANFQFTYIRIPRVPTLGTNGSSS